MCVSSLFNTKAGESVRSEWYTCCHILHYHGEMMEIYNKRRAESGIFVMSIMIF